MAVIGIDLGTTYSVLSYIREGRPTIIPNAEGEDLTPSVIGFDQENHLFVGGLARERSVLDPKGTVASIKRKMGTDYLCKIHGKEYTPVQISSLILGKLKKDATSFLGEEVTGAVVTVPAYFSDVARQATKNAAEIAGLKVLRIINEPTAATLAYGMNQKEGELVMVWDLGGGTFDVSILEFSGGVYEVKATCGDTQLGGDDWRDVIQENLLKTFRNSWGESLSKHPEICHRLLTASEQAKIELTTKKTVTVMLPSLWSKEDHWKSVRVSIDRSQFEEWSRPLLEKLLIPAQQALKDAKIKIKDLDKVILVGGATRMPMVRQEIANFTGKAPYVDIDPDKVVAMGAAVQAGVLEGSLKGIVLVDVISLSLGVETEGGIFTRLIPRNSKVPISKDRIFTTAFDNQPEVVTHVLQGERELAQYNVSLGEFTLADIPDAPKGIPKINVTFSVDVNGILNVRAKEVYTGCEEEMTIRSTRLQSEDLQKMIEEAKEHHEGDQKIKEKIMSRVECDRLIQAAKQSLEEMGIKNSHEDFNKIEALINEGEEKVVEGSYEELKGISKKIKEMMDALYKKWKKKRSSENVPMAT